MRPDALDRPHPARLAPSHRRYDDILAAHRRAVDAGEKLYVDPLTGYWVMSAPALAERGECCDNGCRHCPWVGG